MTRIAAGLSTASAAGYAAREAAREAAAALPGSADLAFVFLSPVHLDEADDVVEALEDELAPPHVLGCVAEGVVGRDRELEDGPAVAVWAASLPGAEIETFHAAAIEVDDGVAVTGFPVLEDPSLVALLVDPFTFPAGPLLAKLNEDFPGLPLVGGIASGGGEPGLQALVHDGEIHDEGAVGAVVSGIAVRTVVSQGCAPIGRDAVITKAEGNLVYELAGQPALDRLREEIGSLPPEKQVLAARGLLAGLVIDENRPDYGRGDFLMRGLLDADEDTGALAVGEAVRVGQTLRFHVRDATSADEDLRAALARELAREKAAGAPLLPSNGPGKHNFREPHPH